MRIATQLAAPPPPEYNDNRHAGSGEHAFFWHVCVRVLSPLVTCRLPPKRRAPVGRAPHFLRAVSISLPQESQQCRETRAGPGERCGAKDLADPARSKRTTTHVNGRGGREGSARGGKSRQSVTAKQHGAKKRSKRTNPFVLGYDLFCFLGSKTIPNLAYGGAQNIRTWLCRRLGPFERGNGRGHQTMADTSFGVLLLYECGASSEAHPRPQLLREHTRNDHREVPPARTLTRGFKAPARAEASHEH